MRILIAVPTFENIYPDTFKSIYDLDKCGHECLFEFVRGYDVAMARNKIASRSLDIDADYVFMVDNDVILPKDTLVHLTEDIKPVQLGIYPARNKKEGSPEGYSVIFGNDVDSWHHQYTMDEIERLTMEGTHKFRIRGGGMGCALIQTEVFHKIRYPYFYWVHFFDSVEKYLSEDLFFCEQCIGFDIPIYSDTRVRCGHIMRSAKY